MLWSEALKKADDLVLALGLEDEDGALPAEAAISLVMPFYAWDELKILLNSGRLFPEDFVTMVDFFVDLHARKAVRKKVELLLQNKVGPISEVIFE